MKKFKFHIGQVVFRHIGDGEYARISNKYRDDEGNVYTLAWQGDECYDEVNENEIRALYKRERE